MNVAKGDFHFVVGGKIYHSVGTVEQFLDTGWYSEATLFYKGRIYWFEGDTDFEIGITKF